MWKLSAASLLHQPFAFQRVAVPFPVLVPVSRSRCRYPAAHARRNDESCEKHPIFRPSIRPRPPESGRPNGSCSLSSNFIPFRDIFLQPRVCTRCFPSQLCFIPPNFNHSSSSKISKLAYFVITLGRNVSLVFASSSLNSFPLSLFF